MAKITVYIPDPNTTKIDTRARGRLAAVKIATDGLNESWRYGTFSFDVKPDGRR
jgi:hypothetical protein